MLVSFCVRRNTLVTFTFQIFLMFSHSNFFYLGGVWADFKWEPPLSQYVLVNFSVHLSCPAGAELLAVNEKFVFVCVFVYPRITQLSCISFVFSIQVMGFFPFTYHNFYHSPIVELVSVFFTSCLFYVFLYFLVFFTFLLFYVFCINIRLGFIIFRVLTCFCNCSLVTSLI